MKHLFTQLPIDIQDLVWGFLENSFERPHWIDLETSVGLFYTRKNLGLIKAMVQEHLEPIARKLQPYCSKICYSQFLFCYTEEYNEYYVKIFHFDKRDVLLNDDNLTLWYFELSYSVIFETDDPNSYKRLPTPIGPYNSITFDDPIELDNYF
jgi:hypothetical protein